MSVIGNIFWFVLGGVIAGVLWYLVGLLWCLTIVGIPIGLQCFKFGKLSFFPFGKDVKISGSTGSIIMNILWIVFGGIEMTLTHVFFGLICCVTIVGIPFGLQHFKLAKIALLPFGAEIISK